MKIGEAAEGGNNGNILFNNLEIWNVVLTEAQIEQYKNCPPTNNEVGLVGYWNFEEGNGNTAYDLSGNGNDGIINGATYSADVPEQSCQLTTINGCDSTAILNLTINEPDRLLLKSQPVKATIGMDNHILKVELILTVIFQIIITL